MSNMKFDVFISYSRKDKSIADQICGALEQVGISYFIDRKGILSGQDFINIIIKAIKESSIFLFLASEHSYASQITLDEVFEALDGVAKGNHKIVTYIIDGSELPDDLRFRLRRYNWRDKDTHPIEKALVPDLLKLLGRALDNKKQKNNVLSDNHENLLEELRKSIELLNSNSMKSKQEGGKLLLSVSEAGLADAQFELGMRHTSGSGVPWSYQDGIKWLTKAAEQGLPNAQYELGMSYYRGGININPNYYEAAKWLKKACANEYGDAYYWMASLYFEGKGVEKNLIESLKLCKKIDFSSIDGKLNAPILINNVTLEAVALFDAEKYEQAVPVFMEAAELNNINAQNYLGYCLYYGMGIKKNVEDAKMWLKKALENGSDYAKYLLEKMKTE